MSEHYGMLMAFAELLTTATINGSKRGRRYQLAAGFRLLARGLDAARKAAEQARLISKGVLGPEIDSAFRNVFTPLDRLLDYAAERDDYVLVKLSEAQLWLMINQIKRLAAALQRFEESTTAST